MQRPCDGSCSTSRRSHFQTWRYYANTSPVPGEHDDPHGMIQHNTVTYVLVLRQLRRTMRAGDILRHQLLTLIRKTRNGPTVQGKYRHSYIVVVVVTGIIHGSEKSSAHVRVVVRGPECWPHSGTLEMKISGVGKGLTPNRRCLGIENRSPLRQVR
jgi:hypothetical protein